MRGSQGRQSVLPPAVSIAEMFFDEPEVPGRDIIPAATFARRPTI